MSKSINIKYALQRALYDSGNCAVVSYCVASLLSRGFKASEAGVVLFLAYVSSFLLQPVVAYFADCSKKNLLNRFLAAEQFIAAVCVFVAITLVRSKLFFGILYLLAITFIDMNNSLFNAISIYYKSRNWKINYELARSFGSAAFAITSLCLGMIMNRFGSSFVVAIGGFIFIALGLLSLSFPDDDSTVVSEDVQSVSSLSSFVKNNPWFFVSMLGIVLLALVHVMVENYLIEVVSRIGGNSSDVGICLFTATAIETPVMLLFGKIHKRIGSYKALLIAGISYVAKVVLFLSAESLFIVYLAQLLQATSYTFLAPSMLYYAKECVKSGDMVKGQSVVMSSFSLGGAVGCLLGGVLISLLGVNSMLVFALCFAAVGTLVLFVTVPKAEYCSD